MEGGALVANETGGMEAWESCPRCGGTRVETMSPLLALILPGSLLTYLILLWYAPGEYYMLIGLGAALLLVTDIIILRRIGIKPFVYIPGQPMLQCQDCQESWRHRPR